MSQNKKIIAQLTYKLRGDTLENWENLDPVLAIREPALVIDETGQTIGFKVGDGHTAWTDLKYHNLMIEPSISVTIDQTYNAESPNAQSGIAVAEGLKPKAGEKIFDANGKQLGEIFNHYEDGIPETHNIDGNKDKPVTVENKKNVASAKYASCFGYGNQATGAYSFALGKNNIASGLGALATGFGTKAIGGNGFTIGYFTEALGDYSTAMGSHTLASGWAAFAQGGTSKATGSRSAALNQGNASAANSFSANQSVASGKLSAAFGKGNAYKEGCFAAGEWTQAGNPNGATGKYSAAFGFNTLAYADYQMAVGKNSQSNLNALFIVGNGSSGSDRKNAFEVLNDGSAMLQTVGESVNSIVNKGYVDDIVGDIETLLGGI